MLNSLSQGENCEGYAANTSRCDAIVCLDVIPMCCFSNCNASFLCKTQCAVNVISHQL